MKKTTLHASLLGIAASARPTVNLSDMIWPFGFETRSLQWPQIYVTKAYTLEGMITGFLAAELLDDALIEDIKATNDPSLAQFGFYTEMKVDAFSNRAMQTIWTDASKTERVTKTLVDYNTQLFYELFEPEDHPSSGYREHQYVCIKRKFGRVVMGIENILKIFWSPSHERFVTYHGPQCISRDEDYFTFEGVASNGEGWLAYFDTSTGMLVEAINGLGTKLDWEEIGLGEIMPQAYVTLKVNKYELRPVGFDLKDISIEECEDGSAEIIEEQTNHPLVPQGDFGFFMN